PSGAAPPRRGAHADGGLAERRAPRVVGRRQPPAAGRARGRARRQGVLHARGAHRGRDRDPGARRDRQHVGVHRPSLCAACAPLVAVVRRRRRAAAPARARAPRRRRRSALMDYLDSPEEAEFRARFKAWLADHNPGLPASSTDDEYWAPQAQWHTALYAAGFFGLSWPKRYGGHELPTVFDVILDEELAAAGAPPRPGLGYLVQGVGTPRGAGASPPSCKASARTAATRSRTGSCPASSAVASAGARASASPTRVLTS